MVAAELRMDMRRKVQEREQCPQRTLMEGASWAEATRGQVQGQKPDVSWGRIAASAREGEESELLSTECTVNPAAGPGCACRPQVQEALKSLISAFPLINTSS